MESGRIRDGQLSASSSFDPSTGPEHARLNTETGSGAWCPSVQINASSQEWIQVELAEESMITGVRTQGRWDRGRGLEFPSAYMIEYWRQALGRWARYKDGQGNEIIAGNSNTQSAVLRHLDGAILAKLVRIIPVSESIRTICVRFELYGCPYKESLLSYSAPIGANVDGLDFRDSSYDGTSGAHLNADGDQLPLWMRGGLGRLFDGAIGEDNFEERPREWLGWHRSQQQQGDNGKSPFVPLEFFFARRQNFSALLVHASNLRKRGARLFRMARLHFAPFGNEFSPRTLQCDVPEDANFETARWIRIPIGHRIASRLRLELHFGSAADWLLLSEVRFESEDAASLLEAPDWPSTNLSYLAEQEVVADDDDGGGLSSTWPGCPLIVLLSVAAILLSSLLICLCFLAFSRRHQKGTTTMKSAPRMFGSTISSYSPPSLHSKSFLLGQFLQNARRKMDTKGYPSSSSSASSQSNSLLKSADNGDGKELMDIARLVMRHDGTTNRRGRGRGEVDGDEESDEYADPDAHICASSSSSVRCPPPSQLHYAIASIGAHRNRPNCFGQCDVRRTPNIGSPNIDAAAYRYRATPTLANFPPMFLPPPLPPAPPPRRNGNE